MEFINRVNRIMYFWDAVKGFGGAANALLQQAVLMKQSGRSIKFVVSDYPGSEAGIERIELCHKLGLDICYLPYCTANQPEEINIYSLIVNYDIIKKAIEEFQPDILHSVQLNPTVEMISREMRIPHIMNIYSISPIFFTLPYMDIFPKYHICDSHYYAKIWEEFLNTDSVCIRTVAEKGNKKNIVQQVDTINYMCVGQIDPFKNQLNVIKAFHKALISGVSGYLSLYGYDVNNYALQCKKYVKENFLTKHVCFKGFCLDMQSEYEKNDVLLCGSTRESYPNVISEALANDVFIISTPVAGVPEIIKDKVNGYICNGYSADDLYEKILEFNEDKKNGRIDSVLSNAQKTYEREHSPIAVQKALDSYYNCVLNEYSFERSGVMIEQINKEFGDIVDIYNKNKSYFTNPILIETKLWYLYYITDIIANMTKDENCRFYIWGTGKTSINTIEILKVFLPCVYLAGVIDSYKSGEYMGHKILNPKEILTDKCNKVFIAVVNGQWEIVKALEDAGYIYNQDYFILTKHVW